MYPSCSQYGKEALIKYDISEEAVNEFGYNLLNQNKNEEALKVFKLNTELYPNGYNTYDSYGECLMKLGQKEKAIIVLDLAMEKMPIETFGYYSLVIPIAAAYYRAGSLDKAQKIVTTIASGYEEYMRYYAQWNSDEQLMLMEDIVANVERYKSLLTEIIKAKDLKSMTALYDSFFKSIMPFSYIYGKYDFYTELTPFVAALYDSDQVEFARDLSTEIAQQYIDLLKRFLKLEDEQLSYFEMEIGIEIQAYKSLVSTVKRNENDLVFSEAFEETYNETIATFSNLD